MKPDRRVLKTQLGEQAVSTVVWGSLERTMEAPTQGNTFSKGARSMCLKHFRESKFNMKSHTE